MSSILKALQRVEKERTPGASPRRALRGDFVAAEGARLRRPRGGKQSRMRLWAALGVVALLAVFVWWRLPERSAETESAAAPESQLPPAAAAPEPAPVAEAPAAVAPPAPAAERVGGRRARAEAAAARVASLPSEPAPAVPPAAGDTEPGVSAEVVAHLPPLGTALEAPPAAPVEPAAPEPAVARAAPVSEPAPAPQAATRAAAQRPEPTAAPAPAPEAAAPTPAPRPAATPAVASTAAAPVPKVARPAPPPPRAPAVLVERTRWHPSAERRRAWVDVEGMSGVRELGEGEAVGALVVKEIRPSSVVFLHGADTLTRRVGARE